MAALIHDKFHVGVVRIMEDFEAGVRSLMNRSWKIGVSNFHKARQALLLGTEGNIRLIMISLYSRAAFLYCECRGMKMIM